MKKNDREIPPPGTLVISTGGRDRGRPYLVLGPGAAGTLLLADGDRRRLANPKPKNPRHLEVTGLTAEEFRVKLQGGPSPKDGELRKVLGELLEVRSTEKRGG